jgi:hypothetical protein
MRRSDRVHKPPGQILFEKVLKWKPKVDLTTYFGAEEACRPELLGRQFDLRPDDN